MAHLKRSVKHRKSSRRYSKARRTRARRGGQDYHPCAGCGNLTEINQKYCIPCAKALRRGATNSGNSWY